MPVASELVARLSADDQLSGPLDQMSGKLSGFAKSASLLGGVATAAFVGIGAAAVGLGAGIASSVGKAIGFQQGIADVGAISNASAAELLQLGEAALKLGQDTTLSGIGATDAAAAMKELAAAGFSVADMTGGVTRGVLLLASATGTDVARAAEIAGDTFNAFRDSMGLTAADMPRIANLFTGAANVSSIGLTDIGESMKYIGPIAASMGISMEDVTAAIAALGNQGIKGSMAGTALRSVIASLAKPSKEASKVINGLGLEFFDAGGNMKDFSGISGELKSKMKGLTDQQRASALVTLFGNEALSAANVLFGEGSEGIQKYIKDIADQGDAAAIGAKRNNTLRGSIESFKGALETAQITLGQAFLPSLKGLVDWATKGVAAAIPLIQAWGPRLVAGISSAIGVITSFGGYVASAIGAVVGAFKALQSGEITMAQFIGGVKSLIAVVLSDIGGLLGGVATFLAPYFAAIGSAITAALPVVATEIGKLASAFGAWIQTTAIPYLATNLPLWRDAIITFVSGTAIPAITTAVGSLASAFGGWIQGTAIPYLTTNLPLWKDAIVAFVTGPAAEAVRGAVVSLATAFSGWVTGTAIPYLQANLGIWLGAFLIWVSGTALPVITEGVKGLAAGLVSWIKGEDITAKFTPWLAAVTQAFANGLALVAEFVKIAGSRLIEWIKSEDTQKSFGDLLITVGKGLADIADAMFDWQNDQVGKLVAYLAENSGLWLGYFVQNNIDFFKWLAEKSAALDQWQKEAIDSLARFGAQLVVETGKAWGDSFAAMADWTGQMVVLATELPGKILSGIGDLTKTLYQKGIDLVQGLINGINSKIGDLISTAGKLASAIANPVGTFFEIKSPSKLMTRWGGYIVQGLINGMDDKQGEAAKKAAEVASAVAKAVTDVLGAMRALSGFNAAKDSPTGEQMGWFRHLTESLIATMGQAAANFKEEALKHTSAFADTVGKVGSSVKNAVEGMAAIGTAKWAEVSPTGSALGWFTHLMTSLVQNFVTAAKGFDEDGLKAASGLADTAGKIGGSISATLGGLAALANADWAKTSPSGSAMAWLTHLVTSLVQTYAAAAATFETGALDGAAKLGESVGKVAGSIGPTLAGLKDIATGVAVPTTGQLDAFFAGVRAVFARFAEMAQTLDGEATEQVGKFATSTGSVMGAAKSATDLFRAFAPDKDGKNALVIPGAKVIDDLANGVAYVVQKFRDMAGMLVGEGLKAVTDFAAGAGQIVGVAKSGADLFKTLAETKTMPTNAVIDYLVGSIGYLITQTRTVAAGIGTEGLLQAQQFATGTLTFVTTVKNALELFPKLAELKGLPGKALEEILGAMGAALELAKQNVNVATDILGQSQTYLDIMREAASNFAQGLALGNGIPAGSALGTALAAPASVPALATGGIVTKPTLALIGERGPEAVVPLSEYNRGARGGGGGGAIYVTIEYHDHTMQGTDRARLADFARSLKPELEKVVVASW